MIRLESKDIISPPHFIFFILKTGGKKIEREEGGQEKLKLTQGKALSGPINMLKSDKLKEEEHFFKKKKIKKTRSRVFDGRSNPPIVPPFFFLLLSFFLFLKK